VAQLLPVYNPDPTPDPMPDLTPGLYRIDALAAIDAPSPGHPGLSLTHPLGVSLVLERTKHGDLISLAAAPTPELARSPRFAAARVIARPGHVLTPALVNAHTHLDLTHIGPRPLANPASPNPLEHDHFAAWLDMVRRERHTDPHAIAASVRAGVALLNRGGIALVGDIAGAVGGQPSTTAAAALAKSLLAHAMLAGISAIEFFAQGSRWQTATEAALAAVESLQPFATNRWQPALSPHAPYSVHADAYCMAIARMAHAHARAQHLPAVITHAAESLAERAFITHARGPLANLLANLGMLDDHARASIGQGRSPIAHLDAALPSGAALTLVHAADLNPHDVNTIAARGWRVIYCPRAAAYFASRADQPPLPPHRYQELLAAGVPVALGTDSVINLPAADLAATGLSVWPEMALLVRQDHLAPRVALAMATVHGCAALNLPHLAIHFRLAPLPHTSAPAAPIAGVLATPLAMPPSVNSLHCGAEAEEILGMTLKAGVKPELIAPGGVSFVA